MNLLNRDLAILMKQNQFLVIFETFNNVQISADLHERTERLIENSCFIQKNYVTNKFEVTISVPRVNDYWLRGMQLISLVLSIIFEAN